jgi:membrane protein YqaA with SNARE-associated domain
MFGYLIGLTVWEEVRGFFYDWIPGFTEDGEAWFRGRYEEWGFLIVLTAGFTPIPYKVFTITSGAMHLSFGVFVLASAVSRSARFFLLALLIRRYGAAISRFIDRYFDKLSIAFVVALLGGFLAVKLLF